MRIASAWARGFNVAAASACAVQVARDRLHGFPGLACYYTRDTARGVTVQYVTIDEALELLRQRKRSLRASELTQLLESFGFLVKDCGKGGHKKIGHAGLEGFMGSSFNAGHGSDDIVKPGYVSNMMRLLRTYQVELEQLMQGPCP